MLLEDFSLVADQKAKKRAGDLLCTAFHEMAYVQRAIHADPHGGNYLFQKDGSIGILDFGCVKRYSQEFICLYSQMGNAIVDQEKKKLIDIAGKLQVLPENTSSVDAEDALWELGCVIAKVFQQDVFFIGNEQDTFIQDVRESSKNLLLYPEVRGPRDMIFLHRALMGIYSMLRKLGHYGSYEKIRRRYANHSISVYKQEENDVSIFI